MHLSGDHSQNIATQRKEEFLVQRLAHGAHILEMKLILDRDAFDVTKVHDESIVIQLSLHSDLQA